MKKKTKDNRPGIRIPTAKGSIKHKSEKDYNRKIYKLLKDLQCYNCRLPVPIYLSECPQCGANQDGDCCTEYYKCDYHKKMLKDQGHVSVWDKFGEEDEN